MSQRWKSLPKEDIDSYVQIAGVHGRPMSIGYGVDAPLTETELVAAATVEGTPRAFVTPLTKLKYNDRQAKRREEKIHAGPGVWHNGAIVCSSHSLLSFDL